MKLLAIETSTEACSVALWIDGQVRERFEVAPRRHAELALPWADELLAEAGIGKSQLDAIAVGRGPGAFTGVRLAVALAQGMALALDLPVVAVSTLAALALRIPSRATVPGSSDLDDEYLLAAIDARMGEVYLGMFQRDIGQLLVPIGEEWMAAPASVQVPAGRRLVGAGTGFAAGDQALVVALGAALRDCDAGALPHATDIVRLAALAYARGEAIAPELIEPAYLRNQVALTIAQQIDARADKRIR